MKWYEMVVLLILLVLGLAGLAPLVLAAWPSYFITGRGSLAVED